MLPKRYLFVFTAPHKVHDAAAMQRRAVHRPAHFQRLLGMWDDGTVRACQSAPSVPQRD